MNGWSQLTSQLESTPIETISRFIVFSDAVLAEPPALDSISRSRFDLSTARPVAAPAAHTSTLKMAIFKLLIVRRPVRSKF
jgi:hypothetical protein